MSEQPGGFARFLALAGKVVRSPAGLQRVAKQAAQKMIKRGGASLAAAQEQLRTLIDLVTAYAQGDYREISMATLVSVVAALLYFIAPLDAVPDFLFGWGLLDDAAVISYVSGQLRKELEAFKKWQDQSD
mgnify:FL=1|tara:strand:- start:23 stop:412 length:390 start_codon:yes stop_codon:yes gene_type:complete